MKKLMMATGLSLFVAGATFATPAKSEIVTTSALVKMCQTKKSTADQNFCHGFSQGVYDMYVASRHPDRNPPFICFPDPGPTRDKVIDSFVGWADNNPQYAKAAAADTIIRYLAGTYPCKK